jgi:hypothetical protein
MGWDRCASKITAGMENTLFRSLDRTTCYPLDDLFPGHHCFGGQCTGVLDY